MGRMKEKRTDPINELPEPSQIQDVTYIKSGNYSQELDVLNSINNQLSKIGHGGGSDFAKLGLLISSIKEFSKHLDELKKKGHTDMGEQSRARTEMRNAIDYIRLLSKKEVDARISEIIPSIAKSLSESFVNLSEARVVKKEVIDNILKNMGFFYEDVINDEEAKQKYYKKRQEVNALATFYGDIAEGQSEFLTKFYNQYHAKTPIKSWMADPNIGTKANKVKVPPLSKTAKAKQDEIDKAKDKEIKNEEDKRKQFKKQQEEKEKKMEKEREELSKKESERIKNAEEFEKERTKQYEEFFKKKLKENSPQGEETEKITVVNQGGSTPPTPNTKVTTTSSGGSIPSIVTPGDVVAISGGSINNGTIEVRGSALINIYGNAEIRTQATTPATPPAPSTAPTSPATPPATSPAPASQDNLKLLPTPSQMQFPISPFQHALTQMLGKENMKQSMMQYVLPPFPVQMFPPTPSNPIPNWGAMAPIPQNEDLMKIFAESMMESRLKLAFAPGDFMRGTMPDILKKIDTENMPMPRRQMEKDVQEYKTNGDVLREYVEKLPKIGDKLGDNFPWQSKWGGHLKSDVIGYEGESNWASAIKTAGSGPISGVLSPESENEPAEKKGEGKQSFFSKYRKYGEKVSNTFQEMGMGAERAGKIGKFAGAASAVAAAIQAVGDTIGKIANSLGDIAKSVGQIGKAMVSFDIENPIGSVVGAIGGIGGGLVGGMSSVGNMASMIPLVGGLIGGVFSGFAQTIGASLEIGTGVLNTILKTLKKIADTTPLFKTILEILNLTFNLFFLPVMTLLAQSLMPSVVKLLNTAVASGQLLANAFKSGGFVEEMTTFVDDLCQKLTDKNIIQKIADFLSDMIWIIPDLSKMIVGWVKLFLDNESLILTLISALEELFNKVMTTDNMRKFIDFSIQGMQWLAGNSTKLLSALMDMGTALIEIAPSMSDLVEIVKDIAPAAKTGAKVANAVVQAFKVPASGPALPGSFIGRFFSNLFATGGYVPATPGGVPCIVGEGGEGEYIIPESKMQSGVTLVFNAPVYGMQDFKQQVRTVMNEYSTKSAFR